MFEARSALAGYASAAAGATAAPGAIAPGAAAQGPVRLSEVGGWHLAHLTAYRSHAPQFREALAAAFGAAPPVALYRAVAQAQRRLVRLTPEQYWWIDTDPAAQRRFAAQLPAALGAVTTLSDGRVRLRIEGPAACAVLQHGIALDLHADAFAVGQSAQTGLHHTGVFLERVAAESYELFVPRTFAATIWEYLVDAALPHGAQRA